MPANLEAYVRSAASRGLLLTGELLRLLKRWDAAGVQAIPFKDPALAVRLYGDPALRHFDDLDVLVRPQAFSAAKQVLLSLGYQPKYQLTPQQEQTYLHSHHHEHFIITKPNIQIFVELHCSVVPEDFPFYQDMEGLWARCEQVPFIGGMTLTTLVPEDLLLHLCLHSSRHLWFRLQWICDVAQLLRTRPDLDWDRLVAQAKTCGGQRMLYLGLYVAHDLLGALLPPEIEQAVRQDRNIAKLAQRVRWQVFEGPLVVIEPWREVLFRLQLIDRPLDRITYLPRFWLKELRGQGYRSQETYGGEFTIP